MDRRAEGDRASARATRWRGFFAEQARRSACPHRTEGRGLGLSAVRHIGAAPRSLCPSASARLHLDRRRARRQARPAPRRSSPLRRHYLHRRRRDRRRAGPARRRLHFGPGRAGHNGGLAEHRSDPAGQPVRKQISHSSARRCRRPRHPRHVAEALRLDRMADPRPRPRRGRRRAILREYGPVSRADRPGCADHRRHWRQQRRLLLSVDEAQRHCHAKGAWRHLS